MASFSVKITCRKSENSSRSIEPLPVAHTIVQPSIEKNIIFQQKIIIVQQEIIIFLHLFCAENIDLKAGIIRIFIFYDQLTNFAGIKGSRRDTMFLDSDDGK